jgi:hypothetical protein
MVDIIVVDFKLKSKKYKFYFIFTENVGFITSSYMEILMKI